MKKAHRAIFLVVFLVLVVLLAFALAGPGGGAFAGVVGGALLRGGAGDPSDPLPETGPPPRHHPHDLHPLGIALERYARTLGPEHIVAVHPLDRDRYEALPARGGGGRGGGGREGGGRGGEGREGEGREGGCCGGCEGGDCEGGGYEGGGCEGGGYEGGGCEGGGCEGGGCEGGAAKPKHWSKFPTWGQLHADQKAVAGYFAQRTEALNNPDFDWGPVMRELAPRLLENREYIGLVNVEADGRTLRLEACEASPVEAGMMKSETAFAAVPAELVRKYAEQPALFMFHTHPADPRGSPLPSSHDLSTAVYLAATGRYAASVVISRYGVIMYSLDWSGYKAVNEAKDWDTALGNLSHDVVAAHEAVRSWSAHSLADYLAFYPRHRLVLVTWPSPEMVADGRRFTYLWNLETPIDHELIAEHRDDIQRRAEKKNKAPRGQHARSKPRGAPALRGTSAVPAEKPPEADLGLD